MMTTRCPWYIAGPLLGLLIIGVRAAVNKPLGALGGYIDIVERATHSRRLGFSAFVLQPMLVRILTIDRPSTAPPHSVGL